MNIYDMAVEEVKKHSFMENFCTVIWESQDGKERILLYYNGRTYRGGTGSSWMYLEYQRLVTIPGGDTEIVYSTKIAFAQDKNNIVPRHRKYTTHFMARIKWYRELIKADDRRAYALSFYFGQSFPSPAPKPEEFVTKFYSQDSVYNNLIPPAWRLAR